jgi:NADP-dependent 3-hydroxy acid dehydrogenase YdfG
MKLRKIKDQVVVIVGASSGIGRLAARTFAQRGAKVIAAARNEEGLKSLAEEAMRFGAEIETRKADVTIEADMESLLQHATQRFGRVDTYIHVAGVELWSEFENTTTDDFRQVIEVNLLGQVNGIRAALPHLKRTAADAGGAACISITSVESKVAFPWQSAYAASKHAAAGMLDALRAELIHQKSNVSVTNVMPASINTPLLEVGKSKMGGEAKGPSPVYDPADVVEALLYAAEVPARDIVVGGAGRLMMAAQAIAPKLMDRVGAYMGYTQMQTNKPRSPSDDGNLYAPSPNAQRDVGRNGSRGVPSLYTWFRTHPTAKMLAVGAGAAALAAFTKVAGYVESQRPRPGIRGYLDTARNYLESAGTSARDYADSGQRYNREKAPEASTRLADIASQSRDALVKWWHERW